MPRALPRHPRGRRDEARDARSPAPGRRDLALGDPQRPACRWEPSKISLFFNGLKLYANFGLRITVSHIGLAMGATEQKQGRKMSDLKWSSSEKKIAREAYDAALKAAITELMAEFKRQASAAASAADLWAVEAYLREQRKEIGEMFDYRYSQLPLVFGWAIRMGYVGEERLAGLSEDKLKIVRSLSQFSAED